MIVTLAVCAYDGYAFCLCYGARVNGNTSAAIWRMWWWPTVDEKTKYRGCRQ